MTAPAHTTHASPASTTRRRARAIAVLAAVLVPAGIWLVAVPLLGYELRAPQLGGPPAEVSLPLVVVGALAASLLGWGLLALLERRTHRARTIWTVIALTVLVVSFTPLLDPEIATPTRIVLALMHVAVAAVLIPGLTRGAPAAAPRLDGRR
jgi:hypothetical protein